MRKVNIQRNQKIYRTITDKVKLSPKETYRIEHFPAYENITIKKIYINCVSKGLLVKFICNNTIIELNDNNTINMKINKNQFYSLIVENNTNSEIEDTLYIVITYD